MKTYTIQIYKNGNLNLSIGGLTLSQAIKFRSRVSETYCTIFAE